MVSSERSNFQVVLGLPELPGARSEFPRARARPFGRFAKSQRAGGALRGCAGCRLPVDRVGGPRAPGSPLPQRREALNAGPGATPPQPTPPDHPSDLGRCGLVGLGVKAADLEPLGHRFESQVAQFDPTVAPRPYIGGARLPTPFTTTTKGAP